MGKLMLIVFDSYASMHIGQAMRRNLPRLGLQSFKQMLLYNFAISLPVGIFKLKSILLAE